MDAEELIDILFPEHDYDTCNDENLSNGFGLIRHMPDIYRCGRCAALEIVKKKYFDGCDGLTKLIIDKYMILFNNRGFPRKIELIDILFPKHDYDNCGDKGATNGFNVGGSTPGGYRCRRCAALELSREVEIPKEVLKEIQENGL